MKTDLMTVILFRKGESFSDLGNLIFSLPDYDELPRTLLYKGFSGQEIEKMQSEIEKEYGKHDAISVPDIGFDCNSYWTAAQYFGSVFCMNIHTKILQPDLIYDTISYHVNNKNVGLVGFFSSDQSVYNLLLEQRKYLKAIVARFLFKKYPNFHIRTNCFAMRREVMMLVVPKLHKTKFQAHLFESGRNGLTNLIKRKGLYVHRIQEEYCKDNRSDYVS